MNITILDASEVEYLARVFAQANAYGSKVRVSMEGGLKVAAGGGMWTPPMGVKADIDGQTPVRNV